MLRAVLLHLTTALALAAPWRGPPANLSPALSAQPLPLDLVSPSGRWVAVLPRPAPVPRASLPAEPLRVAGLYLDERTLAPVTAPWHTELSLRPPQGSTRQDYEPSLEGGRLLDPMWSPDHDRLAVTVISEEGLSLWVVEPETRRARALTGPVLHRATGPACAWLPEDQGLLCKLRTGSSDRSPALSQRPSEPRTEEGHGPAALQGGPRLESAHEASLVKSLLSASLHQVSLDGSSQQVAAASPWLQVLPAADGATATLRSFSGPMRPGDRVADLQQRVELLDLYGRVLLPVEDPAAMDQPTPPLPAPVHRDGALEVPLARHRWGRLVVHRQSPTSPPGVGVRDPDADEGGLVLFHGHADPAPTWRFQRRRWSCPAVAGALFTPPSDGPWPTLVWLSDDPLPHDQAFVRPQGASPLWLTSTGWAVLLLEPGADVEAALGCVDADPSRLVLGATGHAAPQALDLLVNSEHFAAGILQGADFSALPVPLPRTPPLLLLGGELDPVPPYATEAAYRALRAAGVHARWVHLPGEPSQPLSREGVGQVLAEIHAWCEDAGS